MDPAKITVEFGDVGTWTKVHGDVKSSVGGVLRCKTMLSYEDKHWFVCANATAFVTEIPANDDETARSSRTDESMGPTVPLKYLKYRKLKGEETK